MTINYGKRDPGGLTASSPGDTLYIPLQFYNDSGASISIAATLARTDIELFKNGGIVERATDSGYAILGDTGNFDNRIGFKGISIQLFNTADDTGFYDAGSQYWVAVDSVTVDARTVRFFPAVFEIGTPKANVTQIGGDTGAANQLKTAFADGFNDTGVNNRLAVIAADTDTGIQSSVSMTQIRGDTGAADRLLKLAGSQLKTDGTFDTGTGQSVNTFNVTATATTDTGQVNNAVWGGLRADHTVAGSFGQYVIADVDLIDADTGAADRLQKFAGEQLKTDGTLDTGSGQSLNTLNVTATATTDTGQVNNAVWNGLRAVHGAAGSFGEYINADVQLVDADTGPADNLGQMLTGTIVPAVNVDQIDADTGAADQLQKAFADGFADTGVNDRLARILADTDTGIQGGVNVTSFADTGVNDRLAKILADTDTGIQSAVNVTQLIGDTGAASQLSQAFLTTPTYFQQVDVQRVDADTGAATHLQQLVADGFNDTGINDRLAKIASDTDTGIKDGVWDSATRTLTANTNLAGLQVNVTQLVGDTGAASQLSQAFLTTPTYFQQVNVDQIDGDTGAADQLQKAFADGFADTGVNQRLGQIQSDVDTGLRAQISDVDTGLHDTIADLDTGLRGILQTTGVNVTSIDSDTGAADQLGKAFATTPTYFQQVDIQQIDGDTGAANQLEVAFANGFNDTGVNERFARIQSDVDTGLRAQISDVDTGLHSVIANQDTGFTANAVWNALRADHVGTGSFGQYVLGDVQLVDGDTGAATHLQQAAASNQHLLADVRRLNNDTGAAGWLANTFLAGFADTGLNQRLGQIQSDVDTGLRDALADLDTGLRDYIDNTDTGLRAFIDDLDTGIKRRFDDMAEDTGGVNINAIAGDTGAASRLQQFAGTKLSTTGMVDTGTLAGTKAGTIDSNVTFVNETAVQGDGTSGNEWRP